MDISHGVCFVGSAQVVAGDYSDLADAAIIVVTAGAAQKPGETRLDLVQKNAKIMTSVIEQINAIDYKGILLIVSNPVDILTAVAQKVSNLPAKRIVGSGTTLDTARLKHKLGEHLSVDSRDVHAYIIGEHGDSEIAAWSSANVSGVPLSTMCERRSLSRLRTVLMRSLRKNMLPIMVLPWLLNGYARPLYWMKNLFSRYRFPCRESMA